MLQRRKKDFLQRLIEEFFEKLQKFVNEGSSLGYDERVRIKDECFEFFFVNFDVIRADNAEILATKIEENELLQQYALLLMKEYDILDIKNKEELLKALSIVDYLENTDTTYSWERTILREDILRKLDESI